MLDGQTSCDFVEVPVTVSGILRIAKNSSLTRVQMEELAVENFRALLAQTQNYTESAISTYEFDGQLRRNDEMALERDLRYEVRHDNALSVSGGGVAIAPAAGTFGADRLRARITAYVAPDGAYITARDPLNDSERVLCMVNVTEGDIACHVMEPRGDDGLAEEATPGVTVVFPNLCVSLN
jgi:hypothetical protein